MSLYYRRGNKFVPFIRNITGDLCDVFKTRSMMPPTVKSIYNAYVRTSDLPPRCPILAVIVREWFQTMMIFIIIVFTGWISHEELLLERRKFPTIFAQDNGEVLYKYQSHVSKGFYSSSRGFGLCWNQKFDKDVFW